MDDEEKPSENSIRGQSMRKCRTHLRRPFQSEKVLATMRQAEASLKDGVSLVVFPEGHVHSPGTWAISKEEPFSWQTNFSWQ